jgi:hypothetical protein
VHCSGLSPHTCPPLSVRVAAWRQSRQVRLRRAPEPSRRPGATGRAGPPAPHHGPLDAPSLSLCLLLQR